MLLEPVISADPTADHASTSDFEVSLLGPVTVFRSGAPVRMGAEKHRMIVAALALRAGEVISTDALIDVLWGTRPPQTAPKALQVYVSELRKLIEGDPAHPTRITSQPPGYRLSAHPSAIDLRRFESLWEAGREALSEHDSLTAKRRLADALSLWRGEPLSDFTFHDAFAAEIRRLEELRIACQEDHIDAELACGEHAYAIAELEELVRRYPLRERLRGQLMLALYRNGRQADALSVYQEAREKLVEELGIDPSPALVMLERQILQQDASLMLEQGDKPAAAAAPVTRTLVVVSQSSSDLDALCRLGEMITKAGPNRELVIARVVSQHPGSDPSDHLTRVTRVLAARREEISGRGVSVRVAGFSSDTPSADLVKLCAHQDADMLLVDGTSALLDGRFGVIDELLTDATCDVSLHVPRGATEGGGRIVVPFSGSEHDWAALELAALLAGSKGHALVLLGVDQQGTGHDSSRLLATASLVIQRVSNAVPEPVLVSPGAAGILGSAGDAHVITGLSPRFREEGLGETRFQLAENAPGPVTFVRKGTRPGVLAPSHAMTRYTWSVASR